MTASRLGINRRDVLQVAAASGAASLVASCADAAGEGEHRPLAIVDTNVSLFHWPFRRLPLDVTEKLVKKLRSLGVTQAWAGSFEGILHRHNHGHRPGTVLDLEDHRHRQVHRQAGHQV